ncbi:MAG TPA: hypothetical protein VEQ58_05975 [Polyangiaceae bacterium]|nr:hypothetical protein [Polyangiaceae bacterium]
MNRGAAVQLVLLGALGCASQRMRDAPKPPAPPSASPRGTSQAQQASAAASCRAERVLSLEPLRSQAPLAVAELFAPSILTRDDAGAEGAYERISTTVLGAEPPPNASEAVEICRDWPGVPVSGNGRGDRVRIFDVQRVTTTGSRMGLSLALSSTDALEALLGDRDANWQVTLLDSDYHVVARSSFVTERPAEMTLDGVGAVLRLEHGLIHARVAFGCADKNGERFDVPVELAGSCVNAENEASSERTHPTPLVSGACVGQRLSTPTPLPGRLPGYEDTHGKTGPWLAMPYIADDAAALDTDWHRIAMLLSPRSAEPARAQPSENLEASAAVGSPRHATSRWAYVKGAGLRLHQLLPVRNQTGSEAYLALYSHEPPYEIVRSQQSEWHVALLSPSYALLSDVAFTTAPPPASYVALQTELDLRDGSPTASVQYLQALPERSSTSAAASFLRRLNVDIDRGCAALEAP